MPPRASRYALPRELAHRHGIRRFGFHSTSHQYVSRRAAEHLGRPLGQLDLITLHLGNAASAAALADGRRGLPPAPRGRNVARRDPAHHSRRAAPAGQEEVASEANLDGKYLLRCSDPHLSAEDIALGYRQLLQVERGWRDMKTTLELRPVYHRLEDRSAPT